MILLFATALKPDLPDSKDMGGFNLSDGSMPTILFVIGMVLVLAFVGYLLFDAWLVHQRNKRLQKLVRERPKDD